MLNEAHITMTGYVATQPQIKVVKGGQKVLTMRVGWTPRKRDLATGEWVDADSSFLTVTCWRKLAENLSMSLHRGDPVLVRGRLSVREFDGKDGVRRTVVDVEASSVGHDLERGVSSFARMRPPTGQTAAEIAAAAEAGDPADSEQVEEVAEAGADGEASEIIDDDAIRQLDQDRELADAHAGAAAPF